MEGDPCAMCGTEDGRHVPGCPLSVWGEDSRERRSRVRDYPLSDPIDETTRQRLRTKAPVFPGES